MNKEELIKMVRVCCGEQAALVIEHEFRIAELEKKMWELESRLNTSRPSSIEVHCNTCMYKDFYVDDPSSPCSKCHSNYSEWKSK